jgi:glycosyltransferase involved in cell wall biosynthesis
MPRVAARLDGVRLIEVGLHWPPETFLQRKLRGLADRGAHVIVGSPVGWRESRRCRVPGVRPVRLHRPAELRMASVLWLAIDLSALFVRRPRFTVRLIRETRPRRLLRNVAAIARCRPDVVHFEWEAQAVRYLPVLDALGRPVVVSCRGSSVTVNPYAGLEDLAERYGEMFDRADAVHTVSEDMARQAERLGLDRRKAVVIRSGVDAEAFSPRDDGSGPGLDVLSVGTLHWIKHHEDGLRAVALLAAEGIRVRYAIAGAEPPPGDTVKGSDRDRLLYLADELRLEGFELLGRLSHAEVRDRMRRSDVLLHTSLAEGIANCVLEAMATALPVVVTDAGGMREAVTDGIEGYVCPRRDPVALAKALRSIHDDRALAARLGAAGRRRVLSEFTPERETEEYVALYSRVLATRREARRLPTVQEVESRGAV